MISGRPDTQTATSVDVPPMSKVRMRSNPAWDATNDAPLTPPAGPESTVCTAFLHADSRLISPPSERTTWMRRPDVGGCEPVANVRQVLLEHGRDVRVHQRRHGALVLAELGQDLGRDRYRQARGDVGGDLGDHPLVAPVRVGVQQAHRQRLDAVRDAAPRRPRAPRPRRSARRSRRRRRSARAPRARSGCR